jgi:hypothetical protein
VWRISLNAFSLSFRVISGSVSAARLLCVDSLELRRTTSPTTLPTHNLILGPGLPPPSLPPSLPPPPNRASSTLAELKLAEHLKGLAANAEKKVPTFRPGDSIEVKMVTHLTSTETDTYRGVVLSVRKNGADTRFTLADVRGEGVREGEKGSMWVSAFVVVSGCVDLLRCRRGGRRLLSFPPSFTDTHTTQITLRIYRCSLARPF